MTPFGLRHGDFSKDVQMLSVTDTALAHFSQILQEQEAAIAVLRITAKQDGLELVIDEARSGDSSFAYEGRIVLVLEAAISEVLADCTLDLKTTFEGTTLNLN